MSSTVPKNESSCDQKSVAEEERVAAGESHVVGKAESSSTETVASPDNPMVQYVVLRSDLRDALQWPAGAVVAQACHACSALLHTHRDDERVCQYLARLDAMHKVVLSVPDEASLQRLARRLDERDVIYRMWTEQPEDISTCLACIPLPRAQAKPLFKGLKLYK